LKGSKRKKHFRVVFSQGFFEGLPGDFLEIKTQNLFPKVYRTLADAQGGITELANKTKLKRIPAS